MNLFGLGDDADMDGWMDGCCGENVSANLTRDVDGNADICLIIIIIIIGYLLVVLAYCDYYTHAILLRKCVCF